MPPAASADVDQAADTTTRTQATEHAQGGDQTAVDTTTQTSQQTEKAAGATDDTAELVSSGLLEQGEYDKVKGDPVALSKAILKSYTQKTQQLSETRKALGNWSDIKDAFEEDHVTALKTLATQLGLEVREPETKETTQVTANVGDEAVAELKTALAKVGLEELAADLAPVIRKIAEGAAGKATEPIRSNQEKLIEESADRESKAVLDAFGKKFPEWQKHEPAMVALSKKIQPGVDPKTGKSTMTELEYMEQLYFLVTKDDQIKKAAQDAIDRMTKSAETAETRTSTVTGDKVTAGRPKGAGFKQAYEAAKRGERWE